MSVLLHNPRHITRTCKITNKEKELLMSSTVTKTGLVGMFVAVALLAAIAFAPAAQAQTIEELQAQIQSLLTTITSLQAQISSLAGGGTGATACTFTRSLTDGSSGADVTCLQTYLTGTGHFTFAGGATGYFGPVTQAAVAAWQAANGVAPAVGYFGPISQAKYMAIAGAAPTTPTTPTTPTDTTLQGGAGSVKTYTLMGAYNNEKVGEDETDQTVAGLEIKADDGSDIMITAVKLVFAQGTADDNDFEDYAEDVSIWLDGEEFARVDADTFDTDNTYTRTLTLDRGAVIRADAKGELTAAVSGQRNIDSNNTGETWTLDFTSVRFEDALGATISENPSTAARTMTFATFATAAGVELKSRLANDNPDAQVINVHATNDTDDVELLRFILEAEGGDIRVRDLPITLTAVGANVNAVANTLYVTIDGTKYSESITTAATVGSTTMNDFDVTLDEGDTAEVVVTVDINDIEAGTFDEGDTLKAEFTADNRLAADAEDESGEDLASADRTGTALGKNMSFFDVGIKVTLVSASASVATDDGVTNDTGSFEIKYRVEAFDGTVYVSATAEATTATTFTSNADSATANTGATIYALEAGGSATVVGESEIITFTTTGGGSDSTRDVELTEGEYSEFTLTVTRTNTTAIGVADLYRVLLKGIGWSTTNADAKDNIYTFDLEDYKTSPVSVN